MLDRVLEAIVSLRDGSLISCEERRGVQPGIIIEEFIQCENAVKADPRWRAALARRGIRNSIRPSSIHGQQAPMAMSVFPTVGWRRVSLGFGAATPT